MDQLIDVHHHIRSKLPILSIYNTVTNLDIINIREINKRVKNIGVHPLYIDSKIDYELFETLLLDKYTNVGEIGLDKRGDSLETQIVVFKEFLRLAKKYNKSISLHCVKAWGPMLSILDEGFQSLPKLFHGYSGSLDSLKIALKSNSYFSFSLKDCYMNRRIKVIEAMPIGKLLIESDMNDDQFNSVGQKIYLDNINTTYKEIAKIKGVPYNEFVSIINNNFHQFTKEP
ncbi:TatD family hydrolase [Thiospirochaeta perfilievii]|nr:TatD family hydrolase [Thiospirochaeta perfilievii]